MVEHVHDVLVVDDGDERTVVDVGQEVRTAGEVVHEHDHALVADCHGRAVVDNGGREGEHQGMVVEYGLWVVEKSHRKVGGFCLLKVEYALEIVEDGYGKVVVYGVSEGVDMHEVVGGGRRAEGKVVVVDNHYCYT